MHRLFAILLLASAASAQSVVSVQPAPHACGVTVSAPIVVTFDQPMDPASVSAQTVRVFGRWSGPVPGSLTLDATGTQLTFRPARAYFAAETVGLAISSGLTSAAGGALAGGFSSRFWVGSTPTALSFTGTGIQNLRLFGEGPIRTYGAYAGDLNGDGNPDLCTANELSADLRVFMNDGTGVFRGMQTYGLTNGQWISPTEGVDLDMDGDIDVVTANTIGQTIAVFENDGSGAFLPAVMLPVGAECRGLAILDAEGDGDMDVVAGTLAGLELFLNDGAGNLSFQSSIPAGGTEYQIAAADANEDGIEDLFVVNHFGDSVTLLLGDGAGGFAISASAPTTTGSGVVAWGLAVGDINGDGHVDCAVTNSLGASVALVLGDGNGGLALAGTIPVGVFPTSVDMGDLDGDGDLDLSVSNYGAANCSVHENDGSGNFTLAQVLPTSGGTSCSLVVDYDRDGDADLIVTDEIDDRVYYFEQEEAVLPAVQARSFLATLRINEQARGEGFGGRAPVGLVAGEDAFVEVVGTKFASFTLFLGNPRNNGIPFFQDFFNLMLDPALAAVIDGLNGDPLGQLDENGVSRITVGVPLGTPAGTSAHLQAACFAWGVPFNVVLSNPQAAVVLP